MLILPANSEWSSDLNTVRQSNTGQFHIVLINPINYLNFSLCTSHICPGSSLSFMTLILKIISVTLLFYPGLGLALPEYE
jgi:hypothetical protein